MQQKTRKVGVSVKSSEKVLLQRFEPEVRYVKGEGFFPMHTADYVERASLWKHVKRGSDEQVVAEGKLSLNNLGKRENLGFDTVEYLRLVPPLTLQDISRIVTEQARIQWVNEFRSEHTRLTRGGLVARVIDALFSVTLLLRGRVPTLTATAALLIYQQILQKKSLYTYFGRVVKAADWTVLQYWYFYAYNNWRSGFEGVNDHESDWEMVSVYLYEDKGKLWPEWVAYASHDFHGADLRRHWDDDAELTLVNKTHPVVFAGAGSHASYFRQGEYQAEISLPMPDWLRQGTRLVADLGRKVLGEAGGNVEQLLRIPFVDYAVGNGRTVGGLGKYRWQIELIDESTPWVSLYRGLWGLYAKDPISGENAPAGPMYNRDGSPRDSWINPLGFAGLDGVATPVRQLALISNELDEYQEEQKRLKKEITSLELEAQELGVVLESLRGKTHMQKKYQLFQAHLHNMEVMLLTKRQQLSEKKQALQVGTVADLQAHIQHKAEPVEKEQVRFRRLTELWAMVSVSMMLLVLAGVAMFQPGNILLALALVVIVFVAFEALLRGTFVGTVATVAVILATLSTFILVIEFWRWVLIGLTVMVAVYLLIQRVRE
jgi:hypothetical protein